MQPKKLSESNITLLHSFPYLLINGDDGQHMVPLKDAEYWTIGRDHTNSIVLTAKWISRFHATIQLLGVQRLAVEDKMARSRVLGEGGNFLLIDLGSSNGSFVGGQRVSRPIPLKNGDRLDIGKTEMVFHCPQRRDVGRSGSEPLRYYQPPTTPVGNRTILTPSEERVFWQVVHGFTNKEIGKLLQISPRTVQTHISSIMAKLNLENRSQIVRYSYENQLTPYTTDD
jgi:pSer/pThr/pTyr-binding forkhead associated (FHA) protein